MLQMEKIPKTKVSVLEDVAESSGVYPESPESPGLGIGSPFALTETTPDVLGISGSFLCLLHCLAPQLMALGIFGAGFGSFFAGEVWALLFWITCLWAVWRSAATTHFPLAAIALWMAFLLFSAGLALEFFFNSVKGVSYAGSVLLILAHFWNFRLQLQWRKFRKGNCPS